MANLSRRRLLTATGALGLLAVTPAQALDRALRETTKRAIAPAGTTLETVGIPVGAGFRRLAAGPGWPLVVRPDLVEPKTGRDDRRTALTSFVQLTDMHVIDAQSPARVEFVHPFIGSAHRPQETLGTHGAAALIKRVNSIKGPYTGRAFDFVLSTGDNTDNHEIVELEWFLTLLNGGTITPNTGDPARFEGVQNSGSTLYWNPASSVADMYKDKGFPLMPELLANAIKPFTSPGLNRPWYSVFGNHDDSVQGTFPSGVPLVDGIYTGSVKIEGFSSQSDAAKLAQAMRNSPLKAVELLLNFRGPIRRVTPDARRRPFTPKEYVAAHRDPRNTGPGPVGHGFGPANATGRDLYYTFQIASGVVGIGMDTTNRAGLADGSLGDGQFKWVERTLKAGSSRYYDTKGNLVRTSAADTLFVLFSHHTSTSMDNLLPDPTNLLEPRRDGAALVALLNRFPNVVAWVNGHSHRNAITAHRGATPEQGFWEINTASHIDYPQHARIIELTDNGDGTLSLFTTLIEADSPYEADYGDGSPAGLASLYRQVSLNDLHADPGLMGGTVDRNTELVLAKPF
ncbi:TIGR03767 family metallophosphoesterase [Kibdelosporangium aridum]|uniref:Metallophosphoesterase, PPA1498 family n=1 Tax=Kibdelosporangium aridum TaxID=2030 RepID=A0A1W2EUY8_KIBAR|nr:TIGR03767 family metallophosphoesterase [Kibdelosporangium aridum]SMD13517.1 metallophosphoesterase, PPA1498 family [Kibdelosporangium aridum]